MREIDQQTANAFLNNGKMSLGNTVVSSGLVTLHGNDIARYINDSHIKINFCGYPTNVTKARINAIVRQFSNDRYNVRLAFNKNSGNVFLVNDDCQIAMMNGNSLECFYTSPYDGREGFIDELFDDYMEDKDAWHIEDAEWLLEIKSNLG